MKPRNPLSPTALLAAIGTSALLLGTPATAFQSGGAPPLRIAFVVDSTNDNVWRLEDLDADGDFNEDGETTVYYDDTLGTYPLSNNIGVAHSVDGTVYVCDSSQDYVLALVDLDDDGECNDPGESTIFFNGDPTMNAEGIFMSSSQDLVVGPDGRVWVATADVTSGGTDAILYLQDLDMDGDANDVGEVVEYYVPITMATNDSIPQDVEIGLDGHVYYLENGASGLYNKAIYRLEDNDGSGTIDPLTEVFEFFAPTGQPNTPFHWGIDQGADGAWYMADSGNELVWRALDADMDGSIDNATEAVQWWTATGSSLIWQVAAAADGSLYCAESQAPDRVLRMFDSDADGIVDPVTEVDEVYSEDDSTANIGNPRGIALLVEPETMVAYCFGDGSGTPCPCGNSGGSGEGCANSSGAGGLLEVAGSASVMADDLEFSATQLLHLQSVLLFVGDNALNGGLGDPFGDGLRCAGGNVIRLGIEVPDATGSASWGPGLGALGGWSQGETKRFQAWYRDPTLGPCGSTFNLTNAFEVIFQP